MLATLSERFQSVLRDYTTPIVVIVEFYDARHSLKYYQVFSIFPFELVDFIEKFNKRGFATVTFVGLLPPTKDNIFLRYHICTI